MSLANIDKAFFNNTRFMRDLGMRLAQLARADVLPAPDSWPKVMEKGELLSSHKSFYDITQAAQILGQSAAW